MSREEMNTIDHDGYIEKVEGAMARVRIISQSACASCHAKGVCGAADQKTKFLDIPSEDTTLKKGDMVKVLIARNLGLKAVAMGYIYPFILVMVLLFTLPLTGMSEPASGLVALGSLVPYYMGLYCARKRLKSEFKFTIQKS
ncbi:MAG: SoxR reducing system RseC family protein [Bacteroidales bacterium]|nr:SoxR reducing system RseC family protein [Bacteroidales bacterium]MBN2699527.1 SoxR reducing system RseC family protein [Bacteroidales bacterium]